MFITSTHARQGGFDLARIARRESRILGAIRLPNDAFKNNANTEVTTDIVMLRKLNAGETTAGPGVESHGRIHQRRQEKFSINEYFAAHPEMMLGKMGLARRNVPRQRTDAGPDGRDLAEALAQAVGASAAKHLSGAETNRRSCRLSDRERFPPRTTSSPTPFASTTMAVV